jgi:hypothetical protein
LVGSLTSQKTGVISESKGQVMSSVRVFAVLGTTALVFTIILALYSSRLEQTFLDHYPRFYDALSYDFQNATVYLNQRDHGRLAALIDELHHNNRDIFRTVPLLLFAPNLLAKQYGQFATSLPLLFLFGFFLSWECYRLSKSLILAMVALTCLFTLPGLMHPINGYAANWLDMPAAMAMGTAVLGLLRFVKSHELKWLFVFGLFASVTATCRWSAAAYLAFYGFPILSLGLFRFLRHRKNVKNAVLTLCASVGPGVIFVVYHVPSTYWYYTNVCFGMGSTVAEAFNCTIQGLQALCGAVILPLLCLLIATNIFCLVIISRNAFEQALNYCCALWFPVSLMILLCLILKSSQAVHPMVYVVPALFVAAFATELNMGIANKSLFKCSGLLLLLVVIYQSYLNYGFFMKVAKHPAPEVSAVKQLDLTLANYMAKHRIRTYSEYDDERSTATMDCFYASRWKPTYRETSFSIHEPYFKAWYPKKSPLEVANQIFEDNNREVDLVLLHDNVSDVPRNTAMLNPYSLTISSFMTEHVRQSHMWQRVDIWQGPFGPMAVYINKSRVKE